jgi:hypothetical protein
MDIHIFIDQILPSTDFALSKNKAEASFSNDGSDKRMSRKRLSTKQRAYGKIQKRTTQT